MKKLLTLALILALTMAASMSVYAGDHPDPYVVKPPVETSSTK